MEHDFPVLVSPTVRGKQATIHAFHDGTRFVMPYFVSYDYDNIGANDVGPIVCNMGTVVHTLADKTGGLYKEILCKVEPFMPEKPSVLSVKIIVNTNGCYVSGFAEPSTLSNVMKCCIDDEPKFAAEFLGGDAEALQRHLKQGWNFAASVTIIDLIGRQPVFGFMLSHRLSKNVKWIDVEIIDNVPYSTGRIVAVATGHGSLIRDAVDEALKYANAVNISNTLYHRGDVGHDAIGRFAWIRGQGFFKMHLTNPNKASIMSNKYGGGYVRQNECSEAVGVTVDQTKTDSKDK
jgi:hypothetical protein